MNSEALKAFLDQASEAEKDWLANALYYRELETIRREAPLLDPNKYASKKVDVYDSSAAPPGQAVTAAAATISHGPNLQGGAAPDRPPPQYLNRKSGIDIDQLPWLLARVLAKVSTVSLSEDDGEAGNNATPPSGPLSDTRLDIANIRQSIGYTKPFEEQFPDEIQAAKADFLSTGYKYVNQESIFNAPDWLGDLRKFEGRTALLKGFPMVEDVTFLKHPNYWQTIEEHGKLIEDGQCYWSSIGLLLYGNAHSWLRVKAEHLSFLERVLVNPNHPRHAFYSRENQNMGVTYATGPAGLDSQWSGQVNLWERLQIPGCWTNEDLCQLTADVYGVFLVLYKYDTANEANAQWKGKVYDMKTYGAYNNRHIFLCYYLENHFQPMVPNEYCASEFKLPRLTLSNTDRYELVSRKRTRKVRDGPGHHWRAQPQVVPSLAWPSFEAEHLARAAGYGPYVKKSLPRHMSPSHTGSTVLQAPKPEEEVWEEVVWEEGGKGKDKKNASPFANPEALKSPNVTREVVSLLSAETSGRGSSRGLTQADTLRAREALGVLHRYIDKVSGATAADSGRHPLPTGRPSLPAASHNNPQEDLKGKGKRPAIDPPESGPHPSKRPRTPPRAPAQPSTSSNFVSLTPTNRGHQGPSTANPQTHAGPSGTALPGRGSPSVQGPNGGDDDDDNDNDNANDNDDDNDGDYHDGDGDDGNDGNDGNDEDDDDDDDDVGIDLAATFFRAASKTLLTKVRVARLKRWCLDLELAAGDDVAAWRKERCVRELLAAGVQVRLVRAAAGAVVVDEEVEDRGVEVVRVAPAAPVAITGGGAAAAAGEGDGDVDQGQGNAGDDEDGDGDGDNGDGDE